MKTEYIKARIVELKKDRPSLERYERENWGIWEESKDDLDSVDQEIDHWQRVLQERGEE